MTIPPPERLVVVGCSGSGKSTLAQRLASELDTEPTPLDELFFGPDWTPRPPDDFRSEVAEIVAAEQWVIDGSYRVVRDLVWARATTLIWLDYSLPTCFGRLLRRTVRRAFTKESVCNDNQESFRLSFASRDSILLYLLNTHARRRDETAKDLAKPEHAHLQVLHLRKPAEADAITLR